jgi:hypothetical protein
MMNESEILEILSKLGEIKPSADYALRSRNTILSTPRPPASASFPRRAWGLYSLRHFVTEEIGFVLSVGLVSIIAALFLSVPKVFSPIIGNRMPGVDTATLVNDVDAAVKDIDIHLQEAQLFDAAAKNAGSALKETANGTLHINQQMIQKEADGITPKTTNTDRINIDDILNELAK